MDITCELRDGDAGRSCSRINSVELGKAGVCVHEVFRYVPIPYTYAVRGSQSDAQPFFAFAQFVPGENLVGHVVADNEDAVDLSMGVEDGAVAIGPVDVLKASVSSDRNQDVFAVYGFAFLVSGFELRADDVPGLFPALSCGLSQGFGMLLCHERAIAVVVELDHVGSPEDDCGELAGEHHVDGEDEGVGPGFDGAERCGCPIVRPDEMRHFADSTDALATKRIGGCQVLIG